MRKLIAALVVLPILCLVPRPTLGQSALNERFMVVPVDIVPSSVPAQHLWTRIGDVDGDGRNELVVVASRNGTVHMVRLSGDGSWTPLHSIQLPPVPWPSREYASPHIADFDGDGRPDLGVLERGNNQTPAVHILLNSGTGFTVTRYVLATTDSGYNMAAGDLDGDGFPEVVTCNLGYSATPLIHVHWSSGLAGSLFSLADVSTLNMGGSWAVMVYVGDADGDGDPDVGASSAQGGPAINGRIFLNRGARTFDSVDLANTATPRSTHMAFGDVSGDGGPDIVADSHIPSGNGQVLHLYTGAPSGFGSPVQIAGGDPRPLAPVIADFNLDGYLDVVFDQTVQGQIGFLAGSPAGLDTIVHVVADPALAAEDHASGTNIDTLSAGDVDNDGDPDVMFGGSRNFLIRNGPLNHAPIADAGSDQVANAGAACTADVALDGSASSDPDGDPLTFSWQSTDSELQGEQPTARLNLGEHVFTLYVTDPAGATDSDETVVTVVDTAPPVIQEASATPALLWPPDRRMIRVEVRSMAADECSNVSCSIVDVTSNEEVDGDWQIIAPGLIDLRAERNGNGSGRTYSVVLRCLDALGNAAERAVEVRVPRSLKP